jgi:tRNA (guanine-N7-)-methyltransferase
LAEYAYLLAEGGIAYTITDVYELHVWMRDRFEGHPLFERISDEDLTLDPVVPVVKGGTEEGKKVTKSSGNKYLAVFRRIADKHSP